MHSGVACDLWCQAVTDPGLASRNDTRLIRELTLDDLPQIMDIERQGYSKPWNEAVFRDCFRADYRLWGLVEADTLLGYAIVAYLVDEAHLLNLCVARHSRRSGAGRQLLQHLTTEAGHDGMVQVLLEVRVSNQAATRLYLNEGFSEIGRRAGYYPGVDGPEDALVLALGLQPA